jgi:hypothetical protein
MFARFPRALQSEWVLTFGLGARAKADTVEIQWPGGPVDELSNVNARQTVTIEEGKGIVGARPYVPIEVSEVTRSSRPAI